ncbi:Mu transposase C-terminal domain-containing protein [Endozoicomonas euniceicola]|uniref:Mu transposase C-terminal domain-containing protein n=1 Tax=Endozoicomonas euniceicola TaxID=1234143 RepID=A0ABY6GU32_9GAMM|nr:Mu transposase C-terminal domain-containing protein [Endozoicomonas euniceicola]UYM15454.1 Mu transposase C-terminal domain-containing protein [Endozoicomonas euniceicola]
MLYQSQVLIGNEDCELTGVYRIVLAEDNSDFIWLLKLDTDPEHQRNNYLQNPKIFPKEKVRELITKDILTESTVDLPLIFQIDDETLIKQGHKKWIEERNKRHTIIKKLCDVAYEEMILCPYSKECRKFTKNCGYSHRTIVRLFLRYIAFNQNPQSLIPYRYFQGGRGVSKSDSGKKRGRPHNKVKNKEVRKYGINIKSHIASKIILANKKFPGQYAEGHRFIKENYFNIGWEINQYGVKTPILKPDSEIIKYGQYYYHAKKHEEYDHTPKRRLTTAEYYNTVRAKKGRSRDNIYLPAQCYQIDAWRVPVELVSSFDRSKKVGVAIVYVAIDVFSHQYVGLYVDIIEPSWEAIRQLYFNTFTDKVKYCKRYDISIKKEDWDADIIPYSLFLDRGSEMIGRLKREGLFLAGIKEIKTAPPRFAAAKGLVESCFNTLNKALKNVSGSFEKGCSSQKRRFAAWNAALTVDELTKLLINEILFLNSYAKKRQLLNPAMVKDKVLPYPSHIWKWGCDNLLIKGQKKSERELRIYLLHPEQATITNSGVRFRKLMYDSPLLREKGWFFKAKKGSWKVPIRFSIIDSDYIFVYDSENTPYECRLQESYKEYKNSNFVDLHIYQKEADLLTNNTKLQENRDQSEARKKSEQKKIASEAKKATKAANKTNTASKTKQLQDKGQNRIKEKNFRNALRAKEDRQFLDIKNKTIANKTDKSDRERDFEELYGDDHE